jgi:hypothetical protein
MSDGFKTLTVNDPNSLIPFIEAVTGSVLAIISVSIRLLGAYLGNSDRFMKRYGEGEIWRWLLISACCIEP